MKLNVIRQRGLWWTISVVLILASITGIALSLQRYGAPLKPSLDFIGGTRLQIERDCSQADNCRQPINLATVRNVLTQEGVGGSSIQLIDDNGLSIRTAQLDETQRSRIITALNTQVGKFDPARTQIDTVGPAIGQQLLSAGLLALLVAFAGITAYLSLRFKLDYALFALVALFHDVFLVIGGFAILGLVLGLEVDSLFIVALLTVVGFSVNDTVVIYDRVREVLEASPEQPMDDVVDLAVNQTLGRSINTTLTTLLPIVAIFFLGGETLKYFALALIIGFISGSYSSIFIASTLLAWWRNRQQPARSIAAASGVVAPTDDA